MAIEGARGGDFEGFQLDRSFSNSFIPKWIDLSVSSVYTDMVIQRLQTITQKSIRTNLITY